MNMFVLTRNVSASFRVIATLVATAVVMWSLGAYNYTQAANVTDVYDLLSDSSPLAASNHTFEFVAPSGVAAGETIVITFPAGFDLATNSVGEDDVDLEVNGTDEDTDAAPSGTVWGVDITGQVLTITSGTDTIGGTATITVKIGDHADGFGTGANQIINPNPAAGNESFEIAISAGADSGYTRVVILDTVLVTADIESTFTFIVSSVASSTNVNGTTTTITSSSTTIPFGTLSAGQIETIAQHLAVTTNAINGFVVTVEQSQHLLSSTGADIDNFDDSVTSAVPAAWSTPNVDVGNENTWGHWGVTSEDDDTVGNRTNDFTSNTWVGVSTTPQAIFAHDGPSNGSTPGEGSTQVGYQVEISPLQEAADDYNTTLTYIATPTF